MDGETLRNLGKRCHLLERERAGERRQGLAGRPRLQDARAGPFLERESARSHVRHARPTDRRLRTFSVLRATSQSDDGRCRHLARGGWKGEGAPRLDRPSERPLARADACRRQFAIKPIKATHRQSYRRVVIRPFTSSSSRSGVSEEDDALLPLSSVGRAGYSLHAPMALSPPEARSRGFFMAAPGPGDS